MQTIWFIRHGESEANEGKPTSDPTTIRLTNKGHEQAEQVAQAFDQPPSLIIASSYIRTEQTAWATWERFPNVAYEEMPVHEFTYLPSCHYRKSTVDDRLPFVEAYWNHGDPNFVDPDEEGGESFESFIQRVTSVVKSLKSRPEEFIAVFSHEQFIWAVFWLLLFKPTTRDKNAMKQFRYLLTTYPIPNGAILQVQFGQDKPLVKGIIPSHLADTFGTRFSIYTLLYENVAEGEMDNAGIEPMATPLVCP